VASSRAAQIRSQSQSPIAQQRDPSPVTREQALQAEMAGLVGDLKEKHVLLNSRNEELVQVKAELDGVKERAYDLERSTRRCQEAATADNEKMRNEFQAQLAFLQAELSQKQWSLDERQAMVSGLEQRLRAQIDKIENRLEQPQSRPRKGDFILGEPKLPDESSELDWRIKEPATTTANAAGQPASGNHSGRWRTGRSWKRRWRS
jgi:chromosome segregation ATPase